MDDELQLWTVRVFDDAAGRIPLPPRERWIPLERSRPVRPPLALIWVAAAAVALALIVASGLPGRIVPAAPRATPSPLVLVPAQSEDETWGKAWAVSRAAQVLRPTWLPFTPEITTYSIVTSSGLEEYVVGYVTDRDRVPQMLFIADNMANPSHYGRLAAGETTRTVTLRGVEGQLITGADGALRVVWSEAGLTYTVQGAVGTTGADLLRVVDSLRPVTNAKGDVR
jgi:hypothetical protein